MGSGEDEGGFSLEKASCLSFGTDPIVEFNLQPDKKQLAPALLQKGNMVPQQQVDLIIERGDKAIERGGGGGGVSGGGGT